MPAAKTKRILHTADLHLGVRLGRHSRLAEQVARLRDMVKIAIEREVDVFLIAGDVFYERLRREEAARITQILIDEILPLASAGISTLIIRGNHDPSEWFQMSESLLRVAAAQSGNVGALARPLAVVDETSLVHLAGIQFVCAPYPARELLQFSAGVDFENETDPRLQRNRAVAEALETQIGALVASDGFSHEMPSIFVGHFTMANAATPVQEEGFLYDFSGDFTLSSASVPNRFVYWAFGHIHMPQNLHTTKNAPAPVLARYSGSPVRLNMGERDDDKSVTLVEIAPDHTVSLEIIPLECTPMYAIECDWNDLARYEADAARYENAFVRVDLSHDGTLVRHQITRRVQKIFPKTTTIRLHGPERNILPVEDRLLASMTETPDETSVDWNPQDEEKTVRAYLEEYFAGDALKAELIMRAVSLLPETKREYFGDPDALMRQAADDAGKVA